MTNRVSRRQFLEKGGKAALGVGLGAIVADALAAPAGAQSKTIQANEKVALGVIGCGGMGRTMVHRFLDHPDVEIAALCDVDSLRLGRMLVETEGMTGRRPWGCKDFRYLLERKEIDAVVVATPDHWHALPFIMACEAGKDVYVEKPLSYNITEGRAMVAAAKRFDRVVQVGTWQRSVEHFQRAIEFVRSGKMGKIAICRAWAGVQTARMGQVEPSDPPRELDWDFWLGPAPKVPYRKNRCHRTFRWFFDYGGGLVTDWGVHMIDTILLGMDSWHPLEVASYGGKFIAGQDDDRETPDTQIAIFKFPNFILQWEGHVGSYGMDGGRGHGAEFIGEKGILIVDRDGITWRPKGDLDGPEDKDAGVQVSVAGPSAAARDFLDNVKNRGQCRSDVDSMHLTTTACHLANISYLLGRSVRWDGARCLVVGDKEALRCRPYWREYRKPWELPVYKV